MDLFHEFRDVFAWSYDNLCGFYPTVIQHTIHIKDDAMLIRQRQRPINPALEATIGKEVDMLLSTHIIFPIKYLEWVENLVLVWKKNVDTKLCVVFCALNRASVKDIFPLPKMELIL
jgi:hypothetical protein